MATDSKSLVIRPLRSDEAALLVRCFERCYGTTYVNASFYAPDRIAALIDAGSLCSVVAIADDEIVAHMALTIRRPDATTIDAGNTVVDPRYRGHNLATRLAEKLFMLCLQKGYVGFHHYPTTAHAIMQKMAVSGGGVETGLMLGYIPPGTNYRELLTGADAPRFAALIVYQPIAAAPRRQVFVPRQYHALFSAAYASAKLDRSFGIPASAFAHRTSLIDSHFDDRRSLLQITVVQAAADLIDLIDTENKRHSPELIHVDFALSDPATECATQLLRAHGFFLAGMLPEYAAGDVLRMQRLTGQSDELFRPALVTEGG